jgi:hypothetical protein
MDTTNTTFTLHNRTPENLEKAIYAAICRAKEDRFKLPEALLIGIRFGEIEDSMRFIASAGDIYELLEDAGNKLEASLFDVIAVITCGWAAPLGPTGEVSEVAPSDHPDRVRVGLTLIAEEGGICSVMRFANNPDEVTINNSGIGPLADALLDFWTK